MAAIAIVALLCDTSVHSCRACGTRETARQPGIPDHLERRARRPSMTRLRYGIVGAGYMAKLHSLALRNVGPLMFPRFPDIELVRMADIDRDAAIAAAKCWDWADASDDPASV